MKNFVQTVIDRLRGKVFALKPMTEKFYRVSEVKDYDTIILGSSHFHGFIVQDGEINLATASEDLYYSYKLYEKYNNSKVKNIILSFSVFTPGDFLIKSNLCGICVLFKLLCGIDYQFQDIAQKKGLYKLEGYYQKLINKHTKHILNPIFETTKNQTAKPATVVKFNKEKISERAQKHYKVNQKSDKQLEYFIKLLDETLKNGQNLYVVKTPVNSIYKSALPPSDILYKDLDEISNSGYKNLHILNLYDNPNFTDNDFNDGDHVNDIGAIKMTDLIRNFVKNNL